MKQAIAVFLISSAVLLIFMIAQPAQAQTFNTQLNINLLSQLPPPTTTDPPGSFQHVQAAQFDPGKTYLVQATWLSGIGCPTTDTACGTGDPHNKGLLLVKTGATSNNAAAVAELTNVKGTTVMELGYDIRKPGLGTHISDVGSHCGAGAPRFDVVTTDGLFFVGCSSPPPDIETDGQGWIRLRWGVAGVVMGFPQFSNTSVAITGTVQRIVIVFDEAQDASGGPDEFGAAVLDNIDFNGTLVGTGSVTAN